MSGLERLVMASDEFLVGGVALVVELGNAKDLLAKTDSTVAAVTLGAVRYAGSVAKLLPPK